MVLIVRMISISTLYPDEILIQAITHKKKNTKN